MISDHIPERPPPDLMRGAAGRPYPHSSIAPPAPPWHSSRRPPAEPRQRTAHVRDLDAAAVTDPAFVRERLLDRLADPVENRPRARLATIPPRRRPASPRRPGCGRGARGARSSSDRRHLDREPRDVRTMQAGELRIGADRGCLMAMARPGVGLVTWAGAVLSESGLEVPVRSRFRPDRAVCCTHVAIDRSIRATPRAIAEDRGADPIPARSAG